MEITTSDIIAIISIFVSGLTSLFITKHYFKKSNREVLKASVLTPIKHIIDKPVSKEGYNHLLEIASKYEVSYASQNEKDIIWKLIESYYQMLLSNPVDEMVNSVMLYFENTLRGVGVEPRCLSAYDEATHTEFNNVFFPYEFELTRHDIERIIRKYYYDIEIELINMENELIDLLKYKANAIYGIKNVLFFKECSLKTVLENSKYHKDSITNKEKYQEMMNIFHNII